MLRVAAGSFGANEESLLAGTTRGRWSGRATASRNFSTGFMADRDYRNEDASAESWLGSRLGITDLLFAASDRSFGANQFYGPYNSWERTKSWFASARQELGSRTVAAFGYRRHTDEFILLRDNPSVYENNHIDGSWQASLRHTVPIHNPSLLLFGLEADGDSIHSNNLGLHARNRGAGYVDFDLRPSKKRWNLSAGAREEIFSSGAQSGIRSATLRQPAHYRSIETACKQWLWIQNSDLYRPLLLRPCNHQQSQPQAGVGMVGRWRRRLGSVNASIALCHRLLFAPAQCHRLRPRQRNAKMAGGQSQWPALCGRRIQPDLDSDKVADSAYLLDRTPRRAERTQRPSVRIRLQLPGPEHSRFMDRRSPSQLRNQQLGPVRPALSNKRSTRSGMQLSLMTPAKSVPISVSAISATPAIRRSPASPCPAVPSPAELLSNSAADPKNIHRIPHSILLTCPRTSRACTWNSISGLYLLSAASEGLWMGAPAFSEIAPLEEFDLKPERPTGSDGPARTSKWHGISGNALRSTPGKGVPAPRKTRSFPLTLT